MAMIATLAQTSPAILGMPCNFTLAIQNTGGSAVNVTSIQAFARTTAGLPAFGVNLSPVTAPPGTSLASAVGGTQFVVQVTAGATVYFTLRAQMFAPAIIGGKAMGTSVFQIGALCLASDGSVFSAPDLTIDLSLPVFGVSPGSPPNPPVSVGQLNFSTPVNSGLGL